MISWTYCIHMSASKYIYMFSPVRAAVRSKPLTCALAYNKPPPMGANMIPIAKNNGRTVLGVRIGCQAFNRCWRNAVFAGRLLFVFAGAG
jgi:hypothetical protein